MITRDKIKFAGRFITDRFRNNLIYFCYWCYELRYRKILLNNCGYYPTPLQGDNSLQLQLYLALLEATPLPTSDTLNICDIGCGQGHGGMFLLQHHLPAQTQYTGIDISEVAIAYCKFKYRHIKQARFKLSRHGIPAPDASYDMILSVETSAPRYQANLLDMHRCLKPEGLLVFFETYNMTSVNKPDELLAQCGFTIIRKINVTSQLIEAFKQDNTRKLNGFSQYAWLPKTLLAFLKEYMGVVGSERFNNYQSGKRNGLMYILKRNS